MTNIIIGFSFGLPLGFILAVAAITNAKKYDQARRERIKAAGEYKWL